MDFRLFGARNAICVLFALIHLGGPNSVGAVDTPGRIPWGPRVDPRGDRQGATQGTPRWTTLGTHTMDKYRLPNCLPPKQAFIYPAGPRGYPGLSPRLPPGWSAGGGVLRSPGVHPEVPPQGVQCSPWSVGGPWGVQGVIKNKCSPDPSGSPKQTKNRRISIFPQERHAARDLASVLTEASRRLSIGHRISARFCKVGLGRSEAVFGDRG